MSFTSHRSCKHDFEDDDVLTIVEPVAHECIIPAFQRHLHLGRRTGSLLRRERRHLRMERTAPAASPLHLVREVLDPVVHEEKYARAGSVYASMTRQTANSSSDTSVTFGLVGNAVPLQCSSHLG